MLRRGRPRLLIVEVVANDAALLQGGLVLARGSSCSNRMLHAWSCEGAGGEVAF